MIVMKFGGTSVESAAAIERVAGIVKARVGAASRGGGFRHGQDDQQAAGHRRRPPSKASATNTSASFTICAIFIRAKPARWCRSTHRAGLDRIAGRAFPGTDRTGQRTRRARRTDAALDRRHLQLRRAAFQLHRDAGVSSISACPPCMSIRATSSSPTIATRRPRRIFPKPTRAWPKPCRRWRAEHVVVMGGFIASTHEGVTTTLGRGGSDFTRVHRGRGHRRRRNPDLDRRGRHAHRRPDHPARRPSREDHLLRRSRGTGLFRRESAASRHGDSGHREEHSGADSEFAPARMCRARASSPKRSLRATW